MMTEKQKTQLNTRKEHYANNDIMQLNFSVRKAKNSNLPFLNKKQLWLYEYLAKNDIEKSYKYTLDSLSNDYRKNIESVAKENCKQKDKFNFRKSFKASEKIQDSDFKSVAQYFYIVNKRKFDMYRNEKNNYIIHEVEYIDNLMTLKDRK